MEWLRSKRGIVTLVTLGLLLTALRHCMFSSGDTPAPPPAPAQPVATAPTSPPPTPPKAANETDRVILSLFNSPLDGKGLALEQQLRNRYSNAYIGLYLLKGCGIGTDSYNEKLANTFASEWTRQNLSTPEAQDLRSMLASIIEEAGTSYSMLYANTPCEKRNLPALQDYFDAL